MAPIISDAPSDSFLVKSELVNELIDKASGGRGGKIYLAPGEQAPEGVEVITTPRGARYYISQKAKKAGVLEMRPAPRGKSISEIAKQDIAKIEGIGVGGIHKAATMIVDLKNAILAKRPGYNAKRVLYKKVPFEIPCEVAAAEIAEVIAPGWAPEVAPADLGQGPGHVMHWVDDFGMEGATAHRPNNVADWNEQKVRDAARMWALDVLIGNSDRHTGNFFEDDADGGHIRPIDNGFAFVYPPGRNIDPNGGTFQAYGHDVHPDAFYDELKLIGERLREDADSVAAALQQAKVDLETYKGDDAVFGRNVRDKARNIRESGLTDAESVRHVADVMAGLKDAKAEELKRIAERAEKAKGFMVENRLLKHRGKEWRVQEIMDGGFVRVKERGQGGEMLVLDPARARRWANDHIEAIPDPDMWRVAEGKTKPLPRPMGGANYEVDGERMRFERIGQNGDFVFDKRRIPADEMADIYAKENGWKHVPVHVPGGGGGAAAGQDAHGKPLKPGKVMPADLKPGDEVNFEGERLRFKRIGKDGKYVFGRVDGAGEKRIDRWGKGHRAFLWGFDAAAPREERDPAAMPVKGDNIALKVPEARVNRKNWKVAEVNTRGMWLLPANGKGWRRQFVPMARFEELWADQHKPKRAPKAAARRPAAGDLKVGQVIGVHGDRKDGRAAPIMGGPDFKYEVLGFRDGPDGREVRLRAPGMRTANGVPGAWVNEAALKPFVQAQGDGPKAAKPKAAGEVRARFAARQGDRVHVPGWGDREWDVVAVRHEGNARFLKVDGPHKGVWINEDGDILPNDRAKELEAQKPAEGRSPGGRLNRPPAKTPELRAGMRLRIPFAGEAVRDMELVGNAGNGMWNVKVDGKDTQVPRAMLVRRMRQVAVDGKHPVVGWAKRDKALDEAARLSSAVAKAYG